MTIASSSGSLIRKKHQSKVGYLPCKFMSECTAPPRGTLRPDGLQDRAALPTEPRYLLAVTDLWRQLRALKRPCGRATDKDKYRAVSDSGGKHWPRLHDSQPARVTLLSVGGSRQPPLKQNHPAILSSSAAHRLSRSFDWLIGWFDGGAVHPCCVCSFLNPPKALQISRWCTKLKFTHSRQKNDPSCKLWFQSVSHWRQKASGLLGCLVWSLIISLV